MGITPKSYLITAHQIRLWPALTVRCIESEGEPSCTEWRAEVALRKVCKNIDHKDANRITIFNSWQMEWQLRHKGSRPGAMVLWQVSRDGRMVVWLGISSTRPSWRIRIRQATLPSSQQNKNNHNEKAVIYNVNNIIQIYMIRCSINPNQETDLIKIKIFVHVKIDLVISENQKCLLSVYMNVCTFVVWICKVYTKIISQNSDLEK